VKVVDKGSYASYLSARKAVSSIVMNIWTEVLPTFLQSVLWGPMARCARSALPLQSAMMRAYSHVALARMPLQTPQECLSVSACLDMEAQIVNLAEVEITGACIS
jgi:hypothetical protein